MTRWRAQHDAGATHLSAEGRPARWDVETSARWPGPDLSPARRLRLAQQARQDIWRACRHVRGFVPLISVSTDGCQIAMRAGGSLFAHGGHRSTIEAGIVRVLASEANRARWVAHALRAGRGSETCSRRS